VIIHFGGPSTGNHEEVESFVVGLVDVTSENRDIGIQRIGDPMDRKSMHFRN
jgi:hypothetical protein